MPPVSLAEIKVKLEKMDDCNPKVIGRLTALSLKAADVADGAELGRSATAQLETQLTTCTAGSSGDTQKALHSCCHLFSCHAICLVPAPVPL